MKPIQSCQMRSLSQLQLPCPHYTTAFHKTMFTEHLGCAASIASCWQSGCQGGHSSGRTEGTDTDNNATIPTLYYIYRLVMFYCLTWEYFDRSLLTDAAVLNACRKGHFGQHVFPMGLRYSFLHPFWNTSISTSTEPIICIQNSYKLRPAVFIFVQFVNISMQNKSPEQVTAHQWPHHLVAWSTNICCDKMHYQTTVGPWWHCLALKGATEMCIPLQRKVYLRKDFKPKKACHLGKKNPNILYEKVVTWLAETTSSRMGMNRNLGNRGKLYPVHALPRLLWYLSIY